MIDIVFPSLGVIFTNIFGLSIFRAYLINRDNLINEYNEILFYLIIFNGYLWMLYGVIIKDIFIYLSCITSIISSFGFIQILYKHISNDKKIYIEILTLFGLLYLLTLIFLLNFTPINKNIIQNIIGISCTINTIAINISPLLIIRQVIIKHNTELIYLPQIFINSINYSCWLIYAIIKKDIFLMIPNIISLLLLLLILIIYIKVKINNNQIHALENINIIKPLQIII